MSYPKTRVRASRLLEAAFILAIAELTRRLHQAYAQAYDKQAADKVLPQNPEVPLTADQIEAIRKAIEGLLTEKCAKFIDQVVSGQTGKPYGSKTDLLTDFNSIRDGKGGFFFGGTVLGGGATGSLANGNGKVNINDMHSFTDPNRAFGAAFTALHEIIHITAAANDQQLSKGVQDLGITVIGYPGYIVPYPTDQDNSNLAYSSYWGQALKNACDPKGY